MEPNKSFCEAKLLRYYHVYAKARCPWCAKAINLLHEMGYEFVLTLVDSSEEFYHVVKKKYEWQTVPMVVEVDINGEETFIGGYSDMEEYFADYLNADEHTEIAPDVPE